MFSWKSGSREVQPGSSGVLSFLFDGLGEKVVQRVPFQKPIVYTSSALGPSKKGPGERF